MNIEIITQQNGRVQIKVGEVTAFGSTFELAISQFDAATQKDIRLVAAQQNIASANSPYAITYDKVTYFNQGRIEFPSVCTPAYPVMFANPKK